MSPTAACALLASTKTEHTVSLVLFSVPPAIVRRSAQGVRVLGCFQMMPVFVLPRHMRWLVVQPAVVATIVVPLASRLLSVRPVMPL